MADRIGQIANHLNYPKGLLAGQVAIITGSAQGIGAEAARLFANEGAKVVVSDIDAEKSQAIVDKINASGGKAIAVPGDLLKDDYIKELIKKAAEFGNGKIHILVNNAGFTWDAVIHKMTDKQWDTIVNLHGTVPFKLVREAAPYFRVKDGEPRNIINISSTSGLHGNAGQINYALAKAGVTGLTKTIAKEWGPAFGVRANTIAFGHIETRLTAIKELGGFVTVDGQQVALGIPEKQKNAAGPGAFADIPLRRPGSATEAASAVLAIASPLSSYISGQTISVTGGRNI
ncbi:NAD(P)-binding protein [Thozetella sp. PMI_491]|nr:NAD(P)-binding protein [Thozetella sp. PMI_491]